MSAPSSTQSSNSSAMESIDSRESTSSSRKPKKKKKKTVDQLPSRQTNQQDKPIRRTRIVENKLLCYTSKSMIFGFKRDDRPLTRVHRHYTATLASVENAMEFDKDHPSHLVCSLQRSLYTTPMDLQYSYHEHNIALKENLQMRLSMWYIPNSSTFQWPQQFTTPYEWKYECALLAIRPVGPLHREIESVLLVHLLPSQESPDWRQDEYNCSKRLMDVPKVKHCYLLDTDSEGRRNFESDEHKACQLAVDVFKKTNQQCYPPQPILLVMRHNQHLCRVFSQVYGALSLGPQYAPCVKFAFAFDQALLLRTGMAQMSYDSDHCPLQQSFDWPFVTNHRSSTILSLLSARVAKLAGLPWNEKMRIFGSLPRGRQQQEPWSHFHQSANQRMHAFNRYAVFVLQQQAALPESFDLQVENTSVILGKSIQAGLLRFDTAAQQLSCVLRRWPSLWGDVWTSIRARRWNNESDGSLRAFVDMNFMNPWIISLHSSNISDELKIDFPPHHNKKGPLAEFWCYLQFSPQREDEYSIFNSICYAKTQLGDSVFQLFSTCAPVIASNVGTGVASINDNVDEPMIIDDDDNNNNNDNETLPPLDINLDMQMAVVNQHNNDDDDNDMNIFDYQQSNIDYPFNSNSPNGLHSSPMTLATQSFPCGHSQFDICCRNEQSCNHWNESHNEKNDICCFNIIAPDTSALDVIVPGDFDKLITHNSPLGGELLPLTLPSPQHIPSLQLISSFSQPMVTDDMTTMALSSTTPPVNKLRVQIDSLPSEPMTIVQPSSKSPTSSTSSSFARSPTTSATASGFLSSVIAGSNDTLSIQPGDFVVYAGLSCYINHSQCVIMQVESLSVTIASLWLTEDGVFQFGKKQMIPHPNGVMPTGPFEKYETQLFWLPGAINQTDLNGYKARGYFYRSSPPLLPVRQSPVSSPAALQCARVRKQKPLWDKADLMPKSADVVPLFCKSMASAF